MISIVHYVGARYICVFNNCTVTSAGVTDFQDSYLKMVFRLL